MATSKNSKFGIALIQLHHASEKNINLAAVQRLVRKAVKKYAPKMVVLPECFNSTFGLAYFEPNAEYIPGGQTTMALARLAKELKVYIVGGSYPEIDPDDRQIIYNTTTVFCKDGKLIAKHRKMHLSTVRQESTCLTPGNHLNTFYVDKYKFGLGIGYDLFFSEFSQLYQQQGCHMILFPSACPVEYGHLWKFKLRSRAHDNQIFIAGVSAAQTKNDTGALVKYGYSCFVNPNGQFVKKAGKNEKILHYEIDFGELDTIRREVPYINHRRTDIYRTLLVE